MQFFKKAKQLADINNTKKQKKQSRGYTHKPLDFRSLLTCVTVIRQCMETVRQESDVPPTCFGTNDPDSPSGGPLLPLLWIF